MRLCNPAVTVGNSDISQPGPDWTSAGTLGVLQAPLQSGSLEGEAKGALTGKQKWGRQKELSVRGAHFRPADSLADFGPFHLAATCAEGKAALDRVAAALACWTVK